VGDLPWSPDVTVIWRGPQVSNCLGRFSDSTVTQGSSARRQLCYQNAVVGNEAIWRQLCDQTAMVRRSCGFCGSCEGLAFDSCGFLRAPRLAPNWGSHGTLMGFTWAQKQLLRGVRGARVAVAWGLRGAAMGPTSENNILLVLGTCVGGARLV